jgi:hypothetical protein
MTRVAAQLSRRTLLAGAAGLALSRSVRAQTNAASDREGAAMRLRFIFAGQDFTATLEDNPIFHGAT